MGNAGQILHKEAAGLEARHKTGGGQYEYDRRDFVKRGQANQCVVSVYEIPPGKSAYPYHYHCQVEEVFYILSGRGALRTPEGTRPVAAGELLFFPAGAAGELLFFPAGAGGAHQLTNSGQEPLVYLDFDTTVPLDAAVYPDSGKIGLWGLGVNQVYRQRDAVDYYEGE